MSTIYESDIEKFVIQLFQSQDRTFLEVEEREQLRGQDYSQSLLLPKLQEAILRLNTEIPEIARQDAYKQFTNLDTHNLSESNELFHQMMTEGIRVEYQKEHDTVGDRVKVIDFLHPENNEYNVVNQYTMMHGNAIKRPDVVLFVNGIPLIVIELKNPEDEEATLEKAFHQLQTYKYIVPNLMLYNAVLVVSDGLDAKA
jgi:type I restriction enzyme R subunit